MSNAAKDRFKASESSSSSSSSSSTAASEQNEIVKQSRRLEEVPAAPLGNPNDGKGSSSDAMGCAHYKRKCQFYTPCCSKTYRCRFCHDKEENHLLQREDVLEVVCSTCSTKQDVRPECKECGTIFGKYFCYECKLYDDEQKDQFHCDGCGICRIGGRDNFFHCSVCNMCLPSHLSNGRHRCIENLSRANCPICQEDIHTSREPSQIPPCNHLIHKSCFDQLIKAGHYFCPICAHSLVDMREMWRVYDQQISEMPLPVLYRNLFAETYCRDCLKTSKCAFHILGIKCFHCGGYNTVRDRGPLLRRRPKRDQECDDDFEYYEADLTEDDVVVPSGSASLASSSSAETQNPNSPSDEEGMIQEDESQVRLQRSSTEEWDDETNNLHH